MNINRIYQSSMLDIDQGDPFLQEDTNLLKVEDSVKSIVVKIEAARSGKMNNNFVMYTPRAMEQGMLSFVYPFNKHLQDKHNGVAVGIIQEAKHIEEYFPKASDNFIDIVREFKRASEASDGKALAKASRALRASPEYQDATYKGLGIAQIKGTIYDRSTIYQLRTKDPSKGQVSIGGQSTETFCSICGNKANNNHVHKAGRTYAKEICFYIHNDLQLDHCGFVSIPADTYTNTQLVEDSLQDDLTMKVVKYNKQPNSAEHPMNLAALKQKIKDQKAVEALITEYIPEEDKASKAKQLYQESLEDSRPNHYLIGSEELLNIKTPVGILIAQKLVDDLEDSPDKNYFKETLASITKLKGITSIDEALEEALGQSGKSGTVVDPSKGTVVEGNTEQTSSGGGLGSAVAVSNEPLKSELTEDAMTKLSERLAALVDQKIKEREETSKVEDSLRTEYTKQELETLRSTLEADQTALKDMSNKYRQALIDQIVILKAGDVTDDYLEKLSKRNTDQLQSTVEDLREATKQPKKESLVVPPKNTTEEAVNKVEDHLRDVEVPDEAKEAPETKETDPSKEETPEQGEQADPASGEAVNVKDGLNPEQAFYADCKTMGLQAALKKLKSQTNKK